MNQPERGAFLTGSRVYGTPTVKSDIDMVVLLSPAELELLREYADDPGHRCPSMLEDNAAGDDSPTGSFMFGKLNLIVTTSRTRYMQWREGTQTLIARKPVTRDEACELFREIRVRG